jgi:hypothetical protein
MVVRGLGAALVVFAVVAFPLAASGRHSRGAAVTPCRPAVHHDVLPVWMRGGFSDPRPRAPYVLGKRGAIGAVLFAWPLNAPPARNKNNKILWVPRHLSKSAAALWIKMQRMEGARPIGSPVRRILTNGPGPSYVDAPTSGCWRLTLSWSGRRDTLDLAYVPPSS